MIDRDVTATVLDLLIGGPKKMGLLKKCLSFSRQQWVECAQPNLSKFEAELPFKCSDQTHKAEAVQMVSDLMKASANANQVVIWPPNARNQDGIASNVRDDFEVKLQMYVHLAIWLCSYWLGVPFLDEWGSVFKFSNSNNLHGTFPGGPFYDKMAGDAYRFEKRQREKIRANVPPAKGYRNTRDPNDALLVTAYSPLVILPDLYGEEFLKFEIEEVDRVPDELQNEITSEGWNDLRKSTTELSRHYHRLQAWLYIRNHHPIRYAVSQHSISKALYLIAAVPSPGYVATPASLDRVAGEFAKRIDLFFHPETDAVTLTLLSKNATTSAGLTSSVLGQLDGVLSSRPNRPGQPPAYCNWIEGLRLNTERDKLNNILNDQTKQSEHDLFERDGASLIHSLRKRKEVMDEVGNEVTLELVRSNKYNFS